MTEHTIQDIIDAGSNLSDEIEEVVSCRQDSYHVNTAGEPHAVVSFAFTETLTFDELAAINDRFPIREIAPTDDQYEGGARLTLTLDLEDWL